MKRLQLFTLLLFLTSICSAQITLDSIKVYGDSSGFDSVFVQYTSQNQKITDFLFISYNDACSSTNSNIIFEGCSTLTNFQKDTILKFGYWGVSSNLLRLYAVWDTSSICTYPTNPIVADSYLYNICNISSVSESNVLENKITIYPNPARNHFKLVKEIEISIDQLVLINLQGMIIKHYVPNSTIFDINDIANGVYYLKITTSEGIAIKKIMVNKK